MAIQAKNSVKMEATLLADVHDWAAQKLVVDEAFTLLLMSIHPSGKKLTKYDLDSIDEALARCREELYGELSDATGYALVYQSNENEVVTSTPALVFQTELRGAGAHEQFMQSFQLKKKWFSKAREFVPCEDIKVVCHGAPWLREG